MEILYLYSKKIPFQIVMALFLKKFLRKNPQNPFILQYKSLLKLSRKMQKMPVFVARVMIIDGRTNERTDGRTDERTKKCNRFLFCSNENKATRGK